MVAFIWGTAFVAQTTGMKSMGPVTFTGFRLLLGGLVLLPFTYFYFNNKKISNSLTFLTIDKTKFPVEEIIKKINVNNSSPILINAANEIIVDHFLTKKIKFIEIFKYLKLFLNTIEYIKTSKIKANSIEKVRKLDLIGRQLALKLINSNV